MPYNASQFDSGPDPFAAALRGTGASHSSLSEDEREWYRRQLLGKIGLGGAADRLAQTADSLAGMRTKLRGSLAGAVGLESLTSAKGAVKAGAQNAGKKASGAL